ncbi:hypothetical protein [Lysobacter gummosus]|uniref:hypothetical protein n=1 Tax=Lysobacter gummosus TaxID=262324 RepID=UPI00363BB758
MTTLNQHSFPQMAPLRVLAGISAGRCVKMQSRVRMPSASSNFFDRAWCRCLRTRSYRCRRGRDEPRLRERCRMAFAGAQRSAATPMRHRYAAMDAIR